MSLTLHDKQKLPTGRLMFKVYRHGVQIEEFDEQNLVVDLAKKAMSRLIGGSVSGNSVSQIAVGTNGTSPVGGNTVITGAFTKNLDSISYPADNQTSFNFSFSTTEANGMAIMEFGLFTSAGALFARKVRTSALNKDTDISLVGSWIITF